MAKKGYKDYVLSALPGTRQDLRAKTGLGAMTIHRWTTLMHAAGEIHIKGWHRPVKGEFTAIYAVGSRADAKCRLQYMDDAEKSERYRNKLKRDDRWTEVKVRYASRARVKRAVLNAKSKPITWLSALGL